MIHDTTRCIRLSEVKKKDQDALALYIYTGTMNVVCPMSRKNAQGDMFSREVPVRL